MLHRWRFFQSLITSLQNLGLPVSCSSHGPFPISFGNQLLQPLGLSLRQHVGLPALLDGRYVVHDSSKEHFFALKVVEGTLTKLDGDMMQDLSLSDGRQMLEDPVFTFFQVQQLTKVPFHLPPATGGAGGVCKKPSANTEDPVTHFACPLEQCTHKDCKGNLITTKDVEATLYGMNGPTTVLHVQKQCSSRSCRTCFGYNYRWEQGKKINVLCVDDLKDNVLFVNAKKGFTLPYLHYHLELLFRGHLSSHAIDHAYKTVFTNDDAHMLDHFRELHYNGIFYYLVMQELKPLDLHLHIVIEDELPDKHVELYEALCLSSHFPPSNRSKVTTTLVGDGCLRLKVKCEHAPDKRAGRSRKSPITVGKKSNGWFMVCDPKSGRILGLQVMHEPENNQHVIQMLQSTVWLYPHLDCFVYDRACSLQPSASKVPDLERIQHYVVDKFHAHGHSAKCLCNPRVLSTYLSVFHVCTASHSSFGFNSLG